MGSLEEPLYKKGFFLHHPPIMTLSIALYQPDIAGNTGAILRLCACFSLQLHIIEPAGFDISDRNLKRAAMDYFNPARLQRHLDWQTFYTYCQNNQKRLLAFTTHAQKTYYEMTYQPNDVLLFGRESKGLPEEIHQQVYQRLRIPIHEEARSLNLAISAAIAASEALRQLQTL